MKNFFTSMLGALVALLLFAIGSVTVCFVVIAVLAAVNSHKTGGLEPGSYLVYDLSANLKDAPEEFEGADIIHRLAGGGRGSSTLQVRQVTRALRHAAKDSRIAGLYLTGNILPVGYGSGFAALKEVREAITAFKVSGKPVQAYLNFATTRDYYLASAANEVVMDPYGEIYLPGLAAQPMFFAGAFEKFGIGVQVTRVGKYKSAVEPYTRRDLSPEARADYGQLLGDLWQGLLGDIATSRRRSPASLQFAVDSELIFNAAAAHRNQLVDRIASLDEVLDGLKAKTGRRGAKESFKQVTLANYIDALPATPGSTGPAQLAAGRSRIAVVYLEGEIVDGEGDAGYIGGGRFARELRRLRQDDEVKAIVVRVNSPGGSATASEAIQRELRLAMQSKPVVVSMGSYAASGGYLVSAYSNRIFAEPTTITGSIGVFGLFFNVQQLATNLGLTFDTVKTGRFADALTISRPKTPEELALLQKTVDWIYDQFVAKVAVARHLTPEKVEEIGQGRVWSGAAAVKLGLVDEIGGLDAALRFAARKTQLDPEHDLEEFPRKKELVEAVSDLIEGKGHEQAAAGDTMGRLLAPFRTELQMLQHLNDPRDVYARLPFTLLIK